MRQEIPKIWLFFVLFVGIALLGLVFSAPKVNDEEGFTETLPETPRAQTFEGMLAGGENAIYVENQQSGMSEVVVGFALLNEPGYVVIFNDNEGTPGDVIGHSDWLEQGGEHLIISTNQPLLDGQVYYAMLWRDTGDQAFQSYQDAEVVDQEGSIILMTFEAQEEARPERDSVAL